MNDLPAAIEVTQLGDSIQYRLPRRTLGPLRMAAVVIILAGLGGLAFAVFWVTLTSGMVKGDSAWIGMVFMLFAVPLLVADLCVLGVGILALAGHSEIELRDGKLRAIERAGILRWARSRPADRLARLVVKTGQVKINGQPAPPDHPLAKLAVIVAEFDQGKTMWLAPAYPRDLLKPLAEDLSQRSSIAVMDGAVARSEPRDIEVVEEQLEADGFTEREEQPAGSKIILEQSADGVTLTVPPAGIWRGSKGGFFFSLLWCGFMTVFTSIIVGAAFGDVKGRENLLVFFIVIPVFWGIGIAMMLGAINMGKRRAVLAVVGNNTLLAMQTGIFGGKRQEWQRDQIADIRPGPSGMEVNDIPVMELQIQPSQGKKFCMLAGRDQEELAWLATVLRRALRVPAEINA